MKLPLLLTQYLYKTKKLSLPGIGVFTLDPTAVIPDEFHKDLHAAALGISFQNANIEQADNELIEYIKAHTGKIKPLAIADLDSYLTLGTQLLNIGKPFYLEGIGTITKGKEGGFEFTPGEYSVVSMQEGPAEKKEKQVRKKTGLEESQFSGAPNTARNIIIFTAILVGLSLVSWGGYILYKKNTRVTNHEQIAFQPDTVQLQKDTPIAVAHTPAPDSSLRQKPVAAPETVTGTDSVLYKFYILQTHNKERALKRYNQLIGYDLQIKMFTPDSSYFRLFFTFPAIAKDTAHIKDSLQREYAHAVIIEK